MSESSDTLHKLRMGAWRRHDRHWRDNRYVYAVVSRRSQGISVGINLNPGKACNFDCVYCQVNRQVPPLVRRVDLDVLAAELDRVLESERDGSLYAAPPFDVLARDERGIRDIAFSGDGEPTTFRRLEDAVRIAAAARQKFDLQSAKLVLITDAAYLKKPAVRAALDVMDQNNGEIWAKLDAGTEEYFRAVNRPNVTLGAVLDNILDAARVRPVVIQSLWFRMHGEPPAEQELEAYCRCLNSILANEGRLKSVQLYSTARDPAEPCASALTNPELDRLAAFVRQRVAVPIEIYYGVPPQSR
jgi:wyosine [tRNA(Phe)-imidazoG37] synthetase (radical SAM superfamily)